MCGRFTLTRGGRELAETFGLAEQPELSPRYNVAPTQDVAIVRKRAGGRFLSAVRWGLIPAWTRSPAAKLGSGLINARSETVAAKPAFRDALRRRRCIIPADGFYEWAGPRRRRQAHWFRVRGGALFGIAGLWERWVSESGAELESCTLLTTAANESVRPLHDRMPVILDPATFEPWLERTTRSTEDRLALLVPCPAEWISSTPVGRWVHDARNEGTECIAPPDQ